MRWLGLIALLVSLAACTSKPAGPQASDATIAAKAYRAAGPDTLTLITVVNNSSGGGAHTALMINGTQRVIFDPAGSFRHEEIPRRGDVIYGVWPNVLQAYKSAHARSTYHIVEQEVEISGSQAAQLMRLVAARGRVSDAQCAASSTAILAQVEGFESLGSTWFPKRLMERFAKMPGVTTNRYFENDAGVAVDGVAQARL